MANRKLRDTKQYLQCLERYEPLECTFSTVLVRTMYSVPSLQLTAIKTKNYRLHCAKKG